MTTLSNKIKNNIEFLLKLKWKPENFAMFLSCWFSQGKLKKMGNNFSFPLKNSKTEWLKEIL